MTRDTLTREQIVHVAIDLLDAEGIKGLSMRRLGQTLGGATTAAYWHIQSKEKLLAFAADYVWKEVELPDYETFGWRKAAETLAQDTFALIMRHSWLMPAMIDHHAYGPNRATYQEHCYAVLEEAGFKNIALNSAVNTLLTFTFGAAFAESMDSTEAKRIAVEFPRLQSRIADRAEVSKEMLRKSNFDFGLNTILSGLEVQLKG